MAHVLNSLQEKELKWLLEEQVHKDLTEIHATVLVSMVHKKFHNEIIMPYALLVPN